jgi:O-methyltransferase
MNFATKILHTAKLLGPRRFAKFALDSLRTANPIRPWETEPDFLPLAAEISDHTLVDRLRLYMLYQLVKQTRRLPGAVAEVGVYRGGTARFIARLLAGHRPLFLFDTFAGMPDTHPTHDFVRRGDFADTSLEQVRAYLADARNVTFCPGLFPESAGPARDQTFSLVHVDVDIYASILSCCEFFFPRMNPGGVMVFDDYGLITCAGAKIALDEFCAAHGEVPFYLPSGQCLLVRSP